MTAKEKADELVSKMLQYQPLSTMERTEDMNINFAKQCALIAVYEILSNDGFTQFDDYLTEFWQEVKNEIEKL